MMANTDIPRTKGFTMNTRLCCAAICLLAASAVASGQDKVQIKMTYSPGTYEMTTMMDMVNKSAMDGQEQQGQKMTIEMVMTTTVGQADAKGDRPVTMKYTSFKQTIETPGGAISYDSSKPGDKQSEELDRWIDAELPRLRTAKESNLLEQLNLVYDRYRADAGRFEPKSLSATPKTFSLADFAAFERATEQMLELGYQLANAHRESQDLFLARSNQSLSHLQLLISLALLLLLAAG